MPAQTYAFRLEDAVLLACMIGLLVVCWMAYDYLSADDWRQGRRLFARIVSRDSLPRLPDAPAQTQTDEQTDAGLSALQSAIQTKRHDIIRSLIIDILVSNGAGADVARQLIKGDNGRIGAEVEAAKERLGISEPARKLLVRDNGESAREIAFE